MASKAQSQGQQQVIGLDQVPIEQLAQIKSQLDEVCVDVHCRPFRDLLTFPAPI
jgi:hypothetical protein